MSIPTQIENPEGLHQRYCIQKIINVEKNLKAGVPTTIYEVSQVDPKAEYFVLRLDNGGSDKKHIAACREAVLYYASLIKDHLPKLAADLIKRYNSIEFDWKALPAWANHCICCDEDGDWTAFSDIPILMYDEFSEQESWSWTAGEFNRIPKHMNPTNFKGDWRESLLINPFQKSKANAGENN
jgi:hypothetical protein